MTYRLKVSEEDVRKELAQMGHTDFSEDAVATIRKELLKLIKHDIRKMKQKRQSSENNEGTGESHHIPHHSRRHRLSPHPPSTSTPLSELNHNKERWGEVGHSGESGYSDTETLASQESSQAEYTPPTWKNTTRVPDRRSQGGTRREAREGFDKDIWKDGYKAGDRQFNRYGDKRGDAETDKDRFKGDGRKSSKRDNSSRSAREVDSTDESERLTRTRGAEWRREEDSLPMRYPHTREESHHSGTRRSASGRKRISEVDQNAGNQKDPRKVDKYTKKDELPAYPSRPDPVNLYHFYKAHWDKFKPPGDDPHTKLRWALRTKLFYAE